MAGYSKAPFCIKCFQKKLSLKAAPKPKEYNIPQTDLVMHAFAYLFMSSSLIAQKQRKHHRVREKEWEREIREILSCLFSDRHVKKGCSLCTAGWSDGQTQRLKI
jgi:hypothetical protein